MHRIGALLLVAFSFLTLFMIGNSSIQRTEKEDAVDKNKLLTLYTTLPAEHISALVSEFEAKKDVRITVIFVNEDELILKLKRERNEPIGDVILTSRTLLEQARRLDLLSQSITEQSDVVPPIFKDIDNYWVGIWYDVIVFAVNSDYLGRNKAVPMSWDEFKKPFDGRLAVADFFVSEAIANVLFGLYAEKGEKDALNILQAIHPQVVQYARLVSTPARMTGMGECDMAIVLQSDAMRYKSEGFPVEFIFPQDGTMYLVSGGAVIKNSAHKQIAEEFLSWLLQNQAQMILAKSNWHFISTNPENKNRQDFYQTKPVLLDKGNMLSEDEKRKILDKWAQTVRFRK